MALYPLWKRTPILEGKDSEPYKKNIQSRHIFPSGRQLITAILRHEGLSRDSRIAIPEWSSHCLISAVGRICTPVPIKEVLELDIPVDAVIAYEQWGWNFRKADLDLLRDRFRGKPIIIDKIDGIFEIDGSEAVGCYQVWSLSKSLGFKNGAIGLDKNGYLMTASDYLSDIQNSSDIDEVSDLERLDISKSYEKCISQKLAWQAELGKLDLMYKEETAARRLRLEIVKRLNKEDLIVDLFETDPDPAIYPACIDADNDKIGKLMSICEENSVDARVYRFNLLRSPLKFAYKTCLALPLNSDVPTEALQKIAKSYQ